MEKKISLAQRVIDEGKIIKENNFITPKGKYTIHIIEYELSVYFHKMLNDQVVECTRIGKRIFRVNLDFDK